MDLLRRRLIIAASGLTLAGCAVLDRDGTVTLSEREINRLIERRFPIERRLLEVFDVSVSAPRVSLLPDRNRLAALLDLQARERILGSQWGGRLDFDSQLRWEASDQSLRLHQVRVQDLALGAGAGGLGAARSVAERLGAAVAERMLEDLSLYTLPPERAARVERLRRAGQAPVAVAVTARGVEITLSDPAR